MKLPYQIRVYVPRSSYHRILFIHNMLDPIVHLVYVLDLVCHSKATEATANADDLDFALRLP